MDSARQRFLFLNVGHFIDHFLLLIFATVAALRLTTEWSISYSALVLYATPGFIAFGVCAIPAGWLADKWSRQGMLTVFFFGIGISAIAASFATTPTEIGLWLAVLGVFAAIYHPVGLAMVVQGQSKTGMRLAINGVFGNMGVASAALVSGLLIDVVGWRYAFIIPGMFSVVAGLFYYRFSRNHPESLSPNSSHKSVAATTNLSINQLCFDQAILIRIFAVIFFTAAIGGLIFQSTTFALPKIFYERLSSGTLSATTIGGYTFIVFAVAAVGQVVVGYLLDRHSAKAVFTTVAVLQAVLFAVMINLDGMMALLVSIAFMLAVFGQIPINDVLVGRIAKSEWQSRAYAIRYIVTFSVMASAVPFIAWVHGNYGFDMLFKLLVVAASLIFLATLALPKTITPTRF